MGRPLDPLAALLQPLVEHVPSGRQELGGIFNGFCVVSKALQKRSQVNYTWLVVEPTPLKNRKVNWDDEIPN